MTARPEDDLNRSHLLGAAPPRSWSPGQAGTVVPAPSRLQGRWERRRADFGQPLVPAPAPVVLSPRRVALQYVLIGWVLGMVTAVGGAFLAFGVLAVGQPG